MKLNAMAEKIVDAIIGDLQGRAGLSEAFDDIDDDTKKQIRDEWCELAYGRLLGMQK